MNLADLPWVKCHETEDGWFQAHVPSRSGQTIRIIYETQPHSVEQYWMDYYSQWENDGFRFRYLEPLLAQCIFNELVQDKLQS